MKSFSQYAVEKMNALRNSASSQYGSQYKGSRKEGKTQTNCIDFVVKVLADAYEKIGKADVAKDVRKLRDKGTDVAKYLVENRKWSAHYWNPDVRFPADKRGEHPVSYQAAVKHGTYYKIPVAGGIINYRLTPGNGPRTASTAAVGRFKLVPFAMGLAFGGMHTFLVADGNVHEVHWEGIGDSLYGKTAFEKWNGSGAYLSGIVVVPKETSFKSDALQK